MAITYLNRNSNGQGKTKKYSPSSNKPFVDVSNTVDKTEIRKSYLKALERNGGSVDKFLNRKRKRKHKNEKL